MASRLTRCGAICRGRQWYASPFANTAGAGDERELGAGILLYRAGTGTAGGYRRAGPRQLCILCALAGALRLAALPVAGAGAGRIPAVEPRHGGAAPRD